MCSPREVPGADVLFFHMSQAQSLYGHYQILNIDYTAAVAVAVVSVAALAVSSVAVAVVPVAALAVSSVAVAVVL